MRLFHREWRRVDKANYAQDGIIGFHNTDFLKEPRFQAAYKAGEQTGSYPPGAAIHWRLHVLNWAADVGRRLEGDFVECGVNKGGFSLTIMRYLNFQTLPKRFWLYDTFEGLVDSQITEAERAKGLRAGTYEPCYEQVCATFAEYGDQVEIVKGPIPDTLTRSPDKVAFMSIDMNCAEPEVAAAEHFWPRLSPGALIVLDDYGWAGHINQKHAMDDFASRHGVHILTLPTGQGVISKGTPMPDLPFGAA
jgi:O-methyltransferase